jgi:shikimate kinase
MAPKAVLVGLPGSGKSTIGRRLAKALNVGMLDTDAAIEKRTGRRIADIFATDGEEEFRRIEEDVIRAALAEHDGVLSLGGGAVTTPGVRAALAGHAVIYLEITAAEGIRRTGGNTVRPLLAGPGREISCADDRACSALSEGRHAPGEYEPSQPWSGCPPHRVPAQRPETRQPRAQPPPSAVAPHAVPGSAQRVRAQNRSAAHPRHAGRPGRGPSRRGG